jgi:hypothetical protein
MKPANRLKYFVRFPLKDAVASGDCVEEAFEERPTQAQIRRAARKHKNIVAADYAVFPVTENNAHRFLAASSPWPRWSKRLKHKGVALRASIGLIETDRFILEFRDKVKGSYPDGGRHSDSIKKDLLNLDERGLLKILRSRLGKIPLGRCTRCGRAAVLRGLEGVKGFRGCNACYSLQSSEEAKKEEARLAKKRRERLIWCRKRGLKYLAQVWIHPKAGGDDFYVERPFKEKPTRAQLKEIARRRGSAVYGDWAVIDTREPRA